MSLEKVKTELLSGFSLYVDVYLYIKNKLNIIRDMFIAKLDGIFSIYKLGKTWVKQNLDSIVKEYVKRWLHLPKMLT